MQLSVCVPSNFYTKICLSDKYISVIFGSNWLCLFMNGPVSGLMG